MSISKLGVFAYQLEVDKPYKLIYSWPTKLLDWSTLGKLWLWLGAYWCIIQSDHIAHVMEVYKEHGKYHNPNPLYISKFTNEQIKAYLPLKRVVAN